jgi:hypothetical protein
VPVVHPVVAGDLACGRLQLFQDVDLALLDKRRRPFLRYYHVANDTLPNTCRQWSRGTHPPARLLLWTPFTIPRAVAFITVAVPCHRRHRRGGCSRVLGRAPGWQAVDRRSYGVPIGFDGGPFESDFRLVPDGPKITRKAAAPKSQARPGGHNWFVTADPDGNDFCLFATLALTGATGIVCGIDPS